VGVSRINDTVPAFHAHDVGIFTVDPGVSTTRAVATQANAETVIDGVALFAAPHTFTGHTCPGLGDTVPDGRADLADLRFGEGRHCVERGVDVTLKASECIGPGETGRASVEGLSLYFKRLSQLSHAHRQSVTGLLVRLKVLNLSS